MITASPGSVNACTAIASANTTPGVFTSQSSFTCQPCFCSIHAETASKYSSFTSLYPKIPCATRFSIACVISGATLKSISATQSGSTFSGLPRLTAKSYFRQFVFFRFTTILKLIFSKLFCCIITPPLPLFSLLVNPSFL